jgi:DsbC/DsbD-like thiol-disulfide interchange protein
VLNQDIASTVELQHYVELEDGSHSYWYDPGKVNFGFWRKICNYPVLRQQS